MVISRMSTGAQRFDPVFAGKDPTGAPLERGGYWTATYIRSTPSSSMIAYSALKLALPRTVGITLAGLEAKFGPRVQACVKAKRFE